MSKIDKKQASKVSSGDILKIFFCRSTTLKNNELKEFTKHVAATADMTLEQLKSYYQDYSPERPNTWLRELLNNTIDWNKISRALGCEPTLLSGKRDRALEKAEYAAKRAHEAFLPHLEACQNYIDGAFIKRRKPKSVIPAAKTFYPAYDFVFDPVMKSLPKSLEPFQTEGRVISLSGVLGSGRDQQFHRWHQTFVKSNPEIPVFFFDARERGYRAPHELAASLVSVWLKGAVLSDDALSEFRKIICSMRSVVFCNGLERFLDEDVSFIAPLSHRYLLKVLRILATPGTQCHLIAGSVSPLTIFPQQDVHEMKPLELRPAIRLLKNCINQLPGLEKRNCPEDRYLLNTWPEHGGNPLAIATYAELHDRLGTFRDPDIDELYSVAKNSFLFPGAEDKGFFLLRDVLPQITTSLSPASLAAARLLSLAPEGVEVDFFKFFADHGLASSEVDNFECAHAKLRNLVYQDERRLRAPLILRWVAYSQWRYIEPESTFLHQRVAALFFLIKAKIHGLDNYFFLCLSHLISLSKTNKELGNFSALADLHNKNSSGGVSRLPAAFKSMANTADIARYAFRDLYLKRLSPERSIYFFEGQGAYRKHLRVLNSFVVQYLNPNHRYKLYLRAAEISMHLGKVSAATDYYRKSIKCKRGSLERKDACSRLAVILMLKGEWRGALELCVDDILGSYIQSLKNRRRMTPDGDMPFLRGVPLELIMTGFPDVGPEIFKKVCYRAWNSEGDPNTPGAFAVKVAEVKLARVWGRASEARILLDQIISQIKKDRDVIPWLLQQDVFIEQACLLAVEGDRQASVVLFRKIIEKFQKRGLALLEEVVRARCKEAGVTPPGPSLNY